MNKQNKPELRFKGFSEEWEQKKLGEVIHYIKGYAFKSVDYKEDGVRIIRVSDLIRDRVYEKADKVFIDKNLAKQYSKYKINFGDVLITTVGSKAELKESAVGRPIIINENKQYLLNQNLVKISSLQNYCSQFIYNQLLQERYNKYIENIQRGNANQANITIDDLWLYLTQYPTITEQKKIGNFFQTLDQLITLQQNKYDQLVNLKKACLRKMFPQAGANKPELRFKSFSGDWEQKKLGEEVANIIGGGTPSTAIIEYWNGDIDWYSPNEIGKEIYTHGSKNKTTELGLQKSSAKVLPARITILFTSRASIGNMAILQHDGATNQGFQSLVLKKGYCTYFIYSMGYLIKYYAEKYSSGSTFLEISGKVLGNCKIKIPKEPEQKKIGNLFQTFDKLINLRKTELNKLKNLKKSCLAKMFV